MADLTSTPDDVRDVTSTTEVVSSVERDRRGDPDEALSRMGRQRDESRQRAEELERELNDLKVRQQKAADAEAAEQGRWKELAEKRDADLNKTTETLTSVQAERDALSEYFSKDYEAALKNLPEIIREFAPSEDASVATKSAWLTKAKAQADKLEKASAKGNGQNPKTGAVGIDEDAAKAVSRSKFSL